MSDPIIELENVSVRYRLAKHRTPSFKEYAIHWMRGSLTYRDLWALRDVSLEIERGATVGFVGRNGAGKSTLLKVLSGILKPIEGRARVRGHVAPILELGTGFDFELSGLENLRLNALMLGQSNRKIDERAGSIVEFSGLGDFIHSPIRSYSSGMMARLGFSIASGFDPEVLILDEILAVGDTGFQRKCEQRLEELRAKGTTILMVSHVGTVNEYCERCVWLDKGRVIADGPADDIMAEYLAQFEDRPETQPEAETLSGPGHPL